jgi:hypothetical protein
LEKAQAIQIELSKTFKWLKILKRNFVFLLYFS